MRILHRPLLARKSKIGQGQNKNQERKCSRLGITRLMHESWDCTPKSIYGKQEFPTAPALEKSTKNSFILCPVGASLVDDPLPLTCTQDRAEEFPSGQIL